MKYAMIGHRALLGTVLMANLAVFLGIAVGLGSTTLAYRTAIGEIKTLAPAGLGFILAAVLNNLLTSEAKARLVFWRWRHPLPGCQAFTKIARSDHRVDFDALTRKWGPLPTEPRAQNQLWYRLYSPVAAAPSVAAAHAGYLVARDWSSLAVLLFITTVPVAALTSSPRSTAVAYGFLLAGQYLVTRRAAAVNGRRLVANALALASIGEGS